MSKKIKLSIIIVSYNVKDLLKACLGSIDRSKKGFPVEVIVIDNNSTDGSQQMLKDFKAETFNLVVNLSEDNLGFAGGNNLGFKKARGEYIFLLNPDTLIVKDAIQKMVQYMEINPDCHLMGPRLLNNDDTQQASVRKFPTLLSQIFVLTKLHNIITFIPVIRSYLQLDFDYDKDQEVDQIMGAAIIAKAEVIKKLDGFDSHYKRIFEEVDLCKRAKDEKMIIRYYPDAHIVHYKGASFHGVEFKPSLKRQKVFNHDMLRYFVKHHSIWQVTILYLFLPINYFFTLVTVVAVEVFPVLTRLKNKDF